MSNDSDSRTGKKSMRKHRIGLMAIALCVGLLGGDNCMSSETGALGWKQSYRAGYTDTNGRYAGGSEILQLAGHKGRLYAACSYWMDPRNIWYGGKDPSTAWGQILRLDRPGGRWEVDLEMGPNHLRPEIVKSVTFGTDGEGNRLAEPVTLLVASAYSSGPEGVDISVFVRDDETGRWDGTTLVSPTGEAGENNSVRAVEVHRDMVTGIDRIFLPVGVLGIYSGVYDPQVPGKIRWDGESESGPVRTRPLAVIEANGSLLFSTGSLIYSRNDGPSPTYSIAFDASEINAEEVQSAVGGVRGLTAIPNPKGPGESLLFVWSASDQTRGCIFRLDPDGKGGYTRTEEECLDSPISDHFGGNSVHFVGAAFNDILPVTDLETGEMVHLIGINAVIGGSHFPLWMGRETGGFYAGAMYAVRDKRGRYWLNEVNGPNDGIKPPLVAVRAYMLSPFEQDGGKRVYFGGFVGDYGPSPNTAWIFESSVENAVRKDASKPVRLTPAQFEAQLAEMQRPYPFKHLEKPAFTVQIPGQFVQGAPSRGSVFSATKAFNSLSVHVAKLGENADLSDAAGFYVANLKRIGKGTVELEEETRTKLPDGTPAVEVRVKWATKGNLPQTTQALIAHRGGHAVTVATHTEQGRLPNKDFFHTLDLN